MATAKPRGGIPAFAFLVALLAVGASGFLLFKHHAFEMERTAQEGLTAVADLKVGQIGRWLGGQRKDAAVIGGDNLLADEVERWFQQGAPEGVLAQKIRARLASLRQVNEYESIALLDEKARPRLSVGSTWKFNSHDTNLALQAMRGNAVTRSDIHWSYEQKPEMDMAVPLVVPGTSGPRVIGAIYFHIDPDAFLFPFIQTWPTKSPSGETILVRRDGIEVLFLNALRHRKGATLTLRLPIDQPLLVAATALRGQTNVMEGVDYRGVAVIAAARKVPDTPWILVAKLDRAEIEAPIRGLAVTAGWLVALFMVLAGAIAALWWRKQHAQSLAALADEKLERQALERHFDYATKYARDIILLFDETGRVIECNETAPAAYGYTREELLGLTLREVRAAPTDAAIPGDLERAARAGGATFETAHRRKDGSTFPVEVSAHLIEMEGRRFYQGIGRDITERKAAEQALEKELVKHKALMETAIDGIHVVDAEGRLVDANPAFLRMLGYERDEAIGLHITDWDARLSADDVRTKIASLLESGEILETLHRRKDGSIYDAEISISSFKVGDEDYFLTAARDITERKAAHRRINHLTRLYATLSHTNQAVVRARSEQELFDQICRIAVKHGGMLGSIVRIADTETKLLRPVAYSESMRPIVEKVVASFDPARPEFRGPVATAYLEDRIVIDNDFAGTDSAEPWRAIPYAAGIRSAARLPIRRGGRAIGVLALNAGEPDFFDPETRALLEEMTTDITFALDNFEDERRRQQAERALSESEERFRGLVEQSIAGIYIIEGDRLTYVNPRFAELFGYRPEEMIGREYLPMAAEESRALVAENVRKRRSGEVRTMQYNLIGVRKDGSKFTLGVHGTAATIEGRPAIIGLAQDITERERAEETIRKLAYFDSLTGLANRVQLRERLQQAIARARTDSRSLALLSLNIARFHDLVDGLGLRQAEKLLLDISQRLQGEVTGDETLAHLGSNVFAILLSQGDARDAMEVGRKVLQAMHQSFKMDDNLLDVQVHIGIALYPGHGTEPDELILRSDIAARRASETGQDFTLYEGKSDREDPRRLVLVGELRHAIESHQLLLHYQPKVEVASGRVCGVEALVRWQHPERGLVPPDEFISLAEHTGLIKPLTYWVIDEAMRQCVAWQEAGLEMPVAVNISARNLHDPKLVDRIGELFTTLGISPACLQIEITESTLMANPATALEVLTRLNKMGIQLYIDDFGTGYSSLGYLATLPVHALKVDRSFIIKMVNEPNHMAIVSATVALAHSLNLKTVAEGVDAEEQAQILRRFKCDEIQGYLYSRPLAAKEFRDWHATFKMDPGDSESDSAG